MAFNNVVLLSAWALMCYALGTSLFFAIYLISLSLAGGAGILLFTVQHNFKQSYASDAKHWDYDTGGDRGYKLPDLAGVVGTGLPPILATITSITYPPEFPTMVCLSVTMNTGICFQLSTGSGSLTFLAR